jgi:hypothetical protein
MHKRPSLYSVYGQTVGQPARAAATNGFIISQTWSQPRPWPSAYDQLGQPTWQKVPLTILNVVAVEGVDFPFRSRIWVDNAQRNHRKRWADRARAAQPAVAPVALVLLAPVDDTPRFVGKRDETPQGWAVWHKRRRALVAATPATQQWGARAAAFLPATSYPDTSCRIYSEIQRHMLESIIDEGLTWSVWTTDEVENYLTQRVTRFMVDSGLVRERRDVTVTGRDVALPSDTMEVLRTVWNDGAARTVLVRVDKWALDNGLAGWEAQTGIPNYYTDDTSSALMAEVTPRPTTPGVLELVIIASPLPQKHCYPINLPAIFTPYLKWGVIADMLSKEGEAQDPDRAAYAEGRFAEGVELAQLFFAGKKA